MSQDKSIQSNSPTPAKESEQELFKRWDLPDVTVEEIEERELALKLSHAPQPVQVEEEAPQSLTMTAEALEEIRQAAYEEGFEQGRQEGFTKGKEEGLEAGYAEGKEQGSQAGHQEGLAQGQAIIDEKAASLDALMRALHEPQQQIDVQVEQQLVELTAQLAQAVIQQELQTNSAIILQTLREAVDLLPFQQQNIRVQLNPSDLEVVQQTYSDDQIEQRGWRLEAEPTLAVGDLRLLTEQSDVTVSMQERVNKVTHSFLAQLNQLKAPQASSELPGSAPVIGESDEPASE